jgi:flagellar hook-associated protein 1 FlgK
MSSLASIMDSSLGAMFAARVAMQTVGHNVANVNTPGFSRQEVLLAARRPLRLTYGTIGRGVEVQGIRRLTDQYLLANRREQASLLYSYAEVDGSLQEIEAIFGSVENDHLGDAITAYFAAWSDLATPPSDPSMKQAVLSAAQNLVADFHAMAENLDGLTRNLTTSLDQEVGRFNELLEQVAQLNQQLLSGRNVGTAANDILDQRDLLIDEIAKLAQITVVEREDYTVDVIMGGRTVVTRDHAAQFETVWQEVGGERRLSVVTMGYRKDINLAPGSIEGMLTSIESTINDAHQQLDNMAAMLAEKVNDLHVQGRSGGHSGLVFFTGDTAHSLNINPAILENPDLIVTSRSGVEGDNDLALAIAALPDQPLDGEGGATMMDEYRSILVGLASQRDRFEFLVANQDNIVTAINSRLESVRGVSLDEEGANLVRFQNSYEAAARVITAVQDMFETLVNM